MHTTNQDQQHHQQAGDQNTLQTLCTQYHYGRKDKAHNNIQDI